MAEPPHRRRGLSRIAFVAVVVVSTTVVAMGGVLWLRSRIGPAFVASSTARQLKSATQVRQLVFAATLLHESSGADAVTVADLVSEQYINEELLDSPYGPARDGRGDLWLRPTLPDEQAVTDPAAVVVAYDRAMFATEPVVNVGFLDHTVRAVPVEELALMCGDCDLPERR